MSDETKPDILAKLMDLYKQATVERSHNYVGSCVLAAAQEIAGLRLEIAGLRHDLATCKVRALNATRDLEILRSQSVPQAQAGGGA